MPLQETGASMPVEQGAAIYIAEMIEQLASLAFKNDQSDLERILRIAELEAKCSIIYDGAKAA